MKLRDLVEQVKDDKLTKQQLESYETEISNLLSLMLFELADLKKKRALYLDSSQEESVAAKKVKWEATDAGQKLIERKEYEKLARNVKSSIRSRLYSLY